MKLRLRLARHTLPEGVPHLVVYTAFFWFSTAFFIVSTCALCPCPPGCNCTYAQFSSRLNSAQSSLKRLDMLYCTLFLSMHAA